MKKSIIDSLVKVEFASRQTDNEEGHYIYGYSVLSPTDILPNSHIHVVPNPNGLNESMIKRNWGEFMKYTNTSVDDVLDFIERKVVNSPSLINLDNVKY